MSQEEQTPMSTWVGQVRQWGQLETLNSRLCEGRAWLGQSGSQLYPSILAHTQGLVHVLYTY